MKLRIAGTVNDSIVDGPGIRFTVFTQGCPHHCEGCHNPHTHDFNGGSETDTDEIISKFLSNPLLDGITLSGGEDDILDGGIDLGDLMDAEIIDDEDLGDDNDGDEGENE